MGNTLSEEEENAFLEQAYGMSLDNPDFDREVNAGTATPNWQPKHTVKREEEEAKADRHAEEQGLEITAGRNGSKAEVHVPDAKKEEKDKRRKAKRDEREEELEMREREKRLSYMQMARIGYQELVNAIIRPPRADYKIEALGPPAFTFCNRRFTRTDFALVTKRGLSLQCSHWEPVERTSDRIPCVIYMHGNSSARVEVIPQLSYLLSLGLAVFSFDFAGSGKSDGEYVSLGYYEREDLMCVIAHLRATNVVSTIALWGRSMGAATALMHGDRDPSIACMILDSPFADLTQLAEEMVEKGREQGINVPNLVISLALRMIRGSVKRQADFDIRHISPIAHSDKCFIPALFVAGEHDDFINKRHSESIHSKYAGDKNLIIVEGDHNSPRPKFMFDSVSIFLQTCLQIPNSWALKVHPSMNLMAPPWFFPGTPSAMIGNPKSLSRRMTSAVEGSSSKKSNSQRLNRSAPSTRSNSQEMGMTLERQREIQASLFRMLGQSDDQPSPPQGSETTKPSKSSSSSKKPLQKQHSRSRSNQSEARTSLSDSSYERSGNGPQTVNHATTFPPPTNSGEENRSGQITNDDVRTSPPGSEANSYSTADSHL